MIKKKKCISGSIVCDKMRNFRIRYRLGEPRSLPKKECVLKKEKKNYSRNTQYRLINQRVFRGKLMQSLMEYIYIIFIYVDN